MNCSFNSSITISDNDLHPTNGFVPNDLTVFGIIILFKEVIFLNAYEPICSIPSSIIISSISER